MAFLLCFPNVFFQNTSDFECLVTFGAGKWLYICVHPVCFVKTPRILNALPHLVQTNSFPRVFFQNSLDSNALSYLVQANGVPHVFT